MARKTVSEIFKSIASTVNQESEAPAAGTDEFNLWLSYLNRAKDEWNLANEWESKRKIYWPTITGVSTASVLMPSDFEKLAGPVKLYGPDMSEPYKYPYILNEDTSLYNDRDRFITQWGSIDDGFCLNLHPATLSSGASLAVEYFASFPDLVAASEYLPMEDAQYAIDRTIGFILEARSDPRFQLSEYKAQQKLVQMVENENMNKFNNYSGSVPVKTTLQRKGFRLGRD